MYPVRGSRIGGTPLLLEIDNLIDISIVSFTLSCRFSFDFIVTPLSTIFYVLAVPVNSTYIMCPTPDVSSYFNDATNYYMDIFVAINDLDGIYRPHAQQVFTYLRDYTLTSITPSSGYIIQQPVTTILGTNFYNVHTLLLQM